MHLRAVNESGDQLDRDEAHRAMLRWPLPDPDAECVHCGSEYPVKESPRGPVCPPCLEDLRRATR